MITQAQIRRQIISYLRNSISLSDFEDWLLTQSWNMHRDSDADSMALVADVTMLLTRYSDSHLTDRELRLRFFDLVNRVVANFSVEPNLSFAAKFHSSNSMPVPREVSLPLVA